MEALKACYGSSSDSDSSPPRFSDSRQILNSDEIKRLPPPSISILDYRSAAYSQTIHGNRVRSLPHVEGNYALNVFVPGILGSVSATRTHTLDQLLSSARQAKAIFLYNMLSEGIDTFDSFPQPGEEKKKARNIVWSPEMDKCLIEALVEQANEGYKVEKGFKNCAYTAALATVNNRFKRLLSTENIHNRLKTMKRKFRVIQEMLNTPGFKWNASTKQIECGENVWAEYIASHPDAKGFRGKTIEMYDELCIVCGNDQATGQWAKFARGISSRMPLGLEIEEEGTPFQSPMSHMGLDDMPEMEGGDTSSQLPNSTAPVGGCSSRTEVGNQSTSSSRSRKRKDKQTTTSNAMVETLGDIGSSIRLLAEVIQKNRSTIDADTLLQAVSGVEGLDESGIESCFEYLLSNPIKAKAFLAYNVEMRRRFILRQLESCRDADHHY